MSEQGESVPLDLRSLAEVGSPEVVRKALGRFRRRALTRFALLLALVGVVVWFRGFGPGRPSLEDRIDRAPGIEVAVYHVAEATVIVERAADLGQSTGLSFVVADPSAGPNDGLALVALFPLEHVSAGDQEGRAARVSLELRAPASGRLTLKVERSDCSVTTGACPIRTSVGSSSTSATSASTDRSGPDGGPLGRERG